MAAAAFHVNLGRGVLDDGCHGGDLVPIGGREIFHSLLSTCNSVRGGGFVHIVSIHSDLGEDAHTITGDLDEARADDERDVLIRLLNAQLTWGNLHERGLMAGKDTEFPQKAWQDDAGNPAPENAAFWGDDFEIKDVIHSAPCTGRTGRLPGSL